MAVSRGWSHPKGTTNDKLRACNAVSCKSLGTGGLDCKDLPWMHSSSMFLSVSIRSHFSSSL